MLSSCTAVRGRAYAQWLQLHGKMDATQSWAIASVRPDVQVSARSPTHCRDLFKCHFRLLLSFHLRSQGPIVLSLFLLLSLQKTLLL